MQENVALCSNEVAGYVKWSLCESANLLLIFIRKSYFHQLCSTIINNIIKVVVMLAVCDDKIITTLS